MRKVAIAEVVNSNSVAHESPLAAKTPDGIYTLSSSFWRKGQHILVQYETQDQFAHPVDMELVAKLLSKHD